MYKITLLLLFQVLFLTSTSAQKNVRTFIFGHSLINHELQVNPTPSQETSVPHWFHFLAAEAGHEYAVSGQYGFLPQHANVPPIAQWGFDFVTGAWESDYEPFSAADFNNILVTPGNFIQWQEPDENYYGKDISPLDATKDIFEWCVEQEDDLQFFIYENWPDMGPYLTNDFPPTTDDWANYNAYLNNDFHDWFLEYHDALVDDFPNACVRMIPVGPIISQLLNQSPYDQIPITELYEDNAPHGRSTIYFLAALTTYMAMYEEKAPADFEVDPIIHAIVGDNYSAIVDFVWQKLNDFKFANGESRVFCNPIINNTSNGLEQERHFLISPNPVSHELMIAGELQNYHLTIYDAQGNKVLDVPSANSDSQPINVQNLAAGVYLLLGRSKTLDTPIYQRIIKL